MPQHLQRQIDKLREMILNLGTLTEEAVARAIEAVEKRDPVLSRAVIEGDNKIDLMEIDVEEECLHTLALFQPVAFDLRYVVAVLKINNDLERIADLAVNIGEQARYLATISEAGTSPIDLPTMSSRVCLMLRRSLQALVKIDPELARQVCNSDDEVDDIHRQAYRKVEDACRADPAQIERMLHLLSVSRQLERIADHATNIAEDVIYMARGDIARHGRFADRRE